MNERYRNRFETNKKHLKEASNKENINEIYLKARDSAETKIVAQELVQTFLYSDNHSRTIGDLHNEAKSKGVKWSDIKREFRRIKYERDDKLGEALSRNEKILDVKYPYWEIGYERGMLDALFERFLRLENVVREMLNCGVLMNKIAYYTDLSEEELQKMVKSLKSQDNRK